MEHGGDGRASGQMASSESAAVSSEGGDCPRCHSSPDTPSLRYRADSWSFAFWCRPASWTSDPTSPVSLNFRFSAVIEWGATIHQSSVPQRMARPL